MSQSLKIQAVIFDRDGVIINTEGLVIKSIRYALRMLGFELQDEDIPQITGRSFNVYKSYFQNKYDFDIDKYRKIQNDYFYEHLDEAEYFEHTLELIKTLHNKKIPIAITTSAGRDGTMLMLNKVGIGDIFNVIVTQEDCNSLKPDPEPYALTAKNLGIEPKYCVAIEDTALGVESAKKAGMICIAIPNEHTNHQDFSLADVVVKSGKEVYKLLKFE
ncbi:MAG TPA: HAD family phosphatase [Candidatus Dojkabacteria bacterium]|nr:HAD family phosphatase [Candidatus Dojkabacteria bacterium]HRO65728.1 HAD family phosphatase [Candidatus Dojkabacteria bacterium]HRP36342.1 HAD family phosphatase [Candidatus Dojkabacteria bacterium]HRP51635.1 HAD family phosphatase [Candidatus Dojkabacteria bacterium]